MNELKLLLQYSFKNKTRPRKNRKGKEVRPGAFSNIMGFLIVPIIFLAIIIPSIIALSGSFDLNIPLTQLGLDANYTLLELIFAPSFLLMGAIFILQFSPLIVTTLYDNDMNEILLTMPIKRSALFFASTIDSLIMSGIGSGAFLAMAISYFILKDGNIFFSIISTIGYFLFLLTFGIVLGLIMSLFVGKTSAKRMAQLSYFIGIIIFVLIPQFIPRMMANDPENLVENLGNTLKVFMNPFWPHVQFINASNGNILSLIFIFAISIILLYFVYRYSKNLDLSTSRKKSKVKKVEKFKTKRLPLFEKDRKLLFRNSQLLFMMIYPIILPAILSISGMQDLTYMALFFMFIAASYSAMISAYMLTEEIKIWPVPKLFPFKTQTMVNSKVMIATGLYSIEFILLTLVFSLILPFEIFNLILIVPTIVLLYYSSLLGARIFLSDSKRDVSQMNKVFNGKETIIIELVTMGYAVAIFGLLFFYKLMLSQGPMWIFKNLGMQLTSIIILGIVITLVIIIIFSIRKEQKKIERYIDAME
jgi:ABC-2 type transport system permease protein